MTARTALWRVVAPGRADHEHTTREGANRDLREARQHHPEARLQQYDQMTGEWIDVEQP